MILPKQKISNKERFERYPRPDGSSRNIAMDTADYYFDQFRYDSVNYEAESIQDAVEGILDYKEYEYMLNPLGIKVPNKNVKPGAVLRNHNILKGVVNLYMGEFGRRTKEYVVTDFNGEDENKYKEGLNEMLTAYYQQEAINQMNAVGLDTGQLSKEQKSPQEAEEEYKNSFDSNRVIRGQDALDYILYEQEVEQKYKDIYYDWITVGMGYSYKVVRFDNVDYEYVPFKEIYMPRSGTWKMGEDAPFAIRKRFVPLSTIMDLYHDDLDEEDIAYFDEKFGQHSAFFGNLRTTATGERGFIKLPTVELNQRNSYTFNNGNFTVDNILLEHVVYRSFKKYGLLTFINELGEEETIEVTDDYVLNKELGDIKLVWKYKNALYECTRIDESIYIQNREYKENRSELNNNSKLKLPYNSLIARSKSETLQSFIKDGIPYQILINVIHFQMEKVLNKNKGKVLILPYELVPRKKGMDTTKMMEHADASGILWIDGTIPNASYAAQMIKAVDMGLSEYFRDCMDMIQGIKSEYWFSIGMNDQRYSNINQGSGKGTTEQAIARSAVITYDMNATMDDFIKRENQGFLDLSKLAWINGKKGQYILNDTTKKFLELNPDDAIYHMESDYGIFVKDSVEQTENLTAYRSLAGSFAQQQGAMSAVGEMFSHNSVERINRVVAKIEDNNKKHEAYLAEVNGEKAKELQAMQDAAQDKADQLERYKIDMQYQGVVDGAEIRTGNNSRNEPRPANEVEIAMAQHTINKDADNSAKEERRLNQKDKELAIKEKIANKPVNNKS
jgi:hypothetical protein